MRLVRHQVFLGLLRFESDFEMLPRLCKFYGWPNVWEPPANLKPAPVPPQLSIWPGVCAPLHAPALHPHSSSPQHCCPGRVAHSWRDERALLAERVPEEICRSGAARSSKPCGVARGACEGWTEDLSCSALSALREITRACPMTCAVRSSNTGAGGSSVSAAAMQAE